MANLTQSETQMERCYFAFFGLPKPTYEHAKIVNVIREASNGDFKQFPIPGRMGFVFKSKTLPWNLGFGKILMNGDTRFITEISLIYYQEGFGSVAGWLNLHFPRQ